MWDISWARPASSFGSRRRTSTNSWPSPAHIGNTDQPLIRDPQYLDTADYVVMESTYGDRLHSGARVDYVKELTQVIQTTFDRAETW